MEIGVADAGVFNVDKNLIWAGLLNWTPISMLLKAQGRRSIPGICL